MVLDSWYFIFIFILFYGIRNFIRGFGLGWLISWLQLSFGSCLNRMDGFWRIAGGIELTDIHMISVGQYDLSNWLAETNSEINIFRIFKHIVTFPSTDYNQRRWVEYADYLRNIDKFGDRIPPKYHGWLSHQYD